MQMETCSFEEVACSQIIPTLKPNKRSKSIQKIVENVESDPSDTETDNC